MGKFKQIWENTQHFDEAKSLDSYFDAFQDHFRYAIMQSNIFGACSMKIPDIATIDEDIHEEIRKKFFDRIEYLRNEGFPISTSFEAAMAITEEEWEQLELDLSEWANESPALPPKIDLELPEIPKEKKEDSIYCDCLFPKVRKVSMIFSSYDFCDNCKKEKK